jgi:hypothetical protein
MDYVLISSNGGQIMRITEDDVVQAAKEWAVRSHKDSFEAESTALEAISSNSE